MMKEKKKISGKLKLIAVIVAIIIGLGSLYYTKSWITSVISIPLSFMLMLGYFIFREKMKESYSVKKMEAVFPDFIQLMSSNLRAGMTIDKAMLLSSRKEFSPLDKEILRVGKDIVTGKEIDFALLDMGERIKSEKIKKTLNLLISGIRAGGNLAVLLEETATSMRERNFVEKRSASNVLMYVIFIFFAVSVGAPVLFALSTVLVGVMTTLFSSIPQIDTSAQIPFTLTSINISTTFITYFSIVFIIATAFLGSLILGLVSRGEEKEGIKYLPAILAVAITIFFIVRTFLTRYFANFFS